MPFEGTDDTEATVSEFLRRIFPYGTWWPDPPPTPGVKPKDPDFRRAPNFPTDAFAAVALLLIRSSGLNQLLIGDPGEHKLPSLEPALDRMRASVCDGGPDFNNSDTCKMFLEAGKEWSQLPRAPAPVVRHWEKLLEAGDEPVYKSVPVGGTFPSWWTHALAILIIADQACEDVGWGIAESSNRPGERPKQSIVAKFAQSAYFSKNAKAFSAISNGKEIITVSENLETLCLCVDPDVVCVQPKVRTPSVGCTLRGYTHNLALLPPRGVMKTYWQHSPGALRSEDSDTLNLLVVPYPYFIRAKSFEISEVEKWKDDGKQKTPRWGWFHLHQDWLNDRIIEFTEELVSAAQTDINTIHGVLFPEAALNWKIFDTMTQQLMKKFPNLEFVVAGSSSNCALENGNVVLSATFLNVPSKNPQEQPDHPFSTRAAVVTSRWKHHRWRLDEPQISNYALGPQLQPHVHWWEAIPLKERELHVSVFRASSAYTTLICEDLARSDPCHGVLRDVGPNLVFVMLMDGPQLKDRWSARYSTTLADDPGSSVLTYTSLGLIERSNNSGHFQKSRVIALWKDDSGTAKEISCPEGAHGVVLSLSGYPVSEMTLDGRDVHTARAWRFHSYQPVKIRANTPRLTKLIAEVVQDGSAPATP